MNGLPFMLVWMFGINSGRICFIAVWFVGLF